MKYFGIIDENSFKGYSATVKSLLDDTENKEIIDINLENPEDKIIKALEKNTNNISIVSAADMGIKLFQDLLKILK